MNALTREVAAYIVGRRVSDWRPEAIEKIKIHIVDTAMAILSGRHLDAGQHALSYTSQFGQYIEGKSRILGTDYVTGPETAALINGMLAHSDETDDTSEIGRIHPGASIVPAAFAIADHLQTSVDDVINAVLVGYQIGIAFPQAVWSDGAQRMHSTRATHNVGQVMGAVATAGSLLKLDTDQMVYALSYAAQQASGLITVLRESRHVEKAYVYGGLPAEQGVKAALFAQLGFTGVTDVLDESFSFFDSFACTSAPSMLMNAIRDQNAGVFLADIKLYPVGLPIQAAAQAMDEILVRYPLSADEVRKITCYLPSEKAYVVDNRTMPSICLQYILATMIEDGRLNFSNSHDQARLDRNRGSGLLARVNVVHDEKLNPTVALGTRNRAHLTITLKGGHNIRAKVDHLNGTRFAPPTWQHIRKKMYMVLGDDVSSLCECVKTLGLSEFVPKLIDDD